MTTQWSSLQVEDAKTRRIRRKREEKKKLEEKLEREKKDQFRRIVFCVGVVFAFLIAGLAVLSVRLFRQSEERLEEQVTGSLNIRRGTVQVQSRASSLWSSAESGQQIRSGYKVRTEADSVVRISFFDRDEVVLRPGSVCEFAELTHQGAGLDKEFKVIDGDVIFAVAGAGEISRVTTDYITAYPVQVPAMFKVRINRDSGTIDVVVRNGEVRVKDSRQLQQKTVGRGFGITVNYLADYLSIDDPYGVSMVGEAWE